MTDDLAIATARLAEVLTAENEALAASTRAARRGDAGGEGPSGGCTLRAARWPPRHPLAHPMDATSARCIGRRRATGCRSPAGAPARVGQ